jgi:hypothetical protein
MATDAQQPKAKPSNDAYTGMLGIALFALLVGCVVLYMDYSQYGSTPPPKSPTVATDRPAPDWTPLQGKEKAAEEPPPEGKDAKDLPDKKGLR